MREGLYKVEFHTSQGRGRGVVHAVAGKFRGGNSAFAFIGSYAVNGDEIVGKVSTVRHTVDPQFLPLFGTDQITVVLRGTCAGEIVDFDGSALQVPSLPLRVVLTPISD